MELHEINKIKDNIEEFELVFNTYYTYWLEFFRSKNKENDIYQLAHPGLEEAAIKLQACFLALPEVLQQRLLALDFEIFLHCDNSVDFYSFRDFALENGRFYDIATVSARVDSELKLSKMLIDKNNLEEYQLLPKRNFNFYRTNKSGSLLTDLDNLRVTEDEKVSDGSANFQKEDGQAINLTDSDKKESYNHETQEPKEGLFAKIVKLTKNGNDIVNSGSNIITKTMPAIKYLLKQIIN